MGYFFKDRTVTTMLGIREFVQNTISNYPHTKTHAFKTRREDGGIVSDTDDTEGLGYVYIASDDHLAAWASL